MSLALELHDLLKTYLRRHGVAAITVDTADAWRLDAAFTLPGIGRCRARNVRKGDVPAFHAFGAGLSERSKDLFSPYPWNEPEKLKGAFQAAIDASVNRVDAAYFLEMEGEPVGHFFLWKAGGNPHARAHGVEVPELGVAVADAWQGRGFGGLMVRILTAVARSLGADAVELTTALDNEPGWQTYLRAGYEYTGIIRNPQFVDVTAVAAGAATAAVWRDERQMILLLNETKRDAVLHYLAVKREEALKM
ncbi:MAG: Acetyltransferase (GNAT) family protein [bacterium ADurb.Bin429]|nr:MAG: Acetyltransferase (GNAT) family protein [bacterium ADurb.Bin429]